ncbi:O-antigen ligase family protein [Muribacter muris]|uniref:O-antigen ligase family protein n=1 Tax=Muribacter muris TaxID=67855 RepID=A0A4Y9K4B3_9PAST|nr:O-antigen ligase family protein [Muribacter muris]MBF0784228.1 O-antigen ligase family protein [Muribacter muris]MBF0827034.1 O-antigen ligase family protein [Muribacter muris]TFV12971.1 O-antigen ligase family protein [Muribacter muris]
MFSRLDAKISLFSTACIGLFFLLILHFKWSYNVLPMLLSLIGIAVIVQGVKQTPWRLERRNKGLIIAFIGYFLLFILSLLIHQGKAKELDLPSRMLLVLPLLAVCYRFKPNPLWILYAIVLATLSAGVVAVVQFFGLGMPHIFPVHMYIQSGGIIMSLAMFSLAAAFFFKQRRMHLWLWLSIFACGVGILAAVLNQSRGPWVVAPFILAVILWFNRKLLSKWFIVLLLLIALVAGGFGGHLIEQRWQQARNDITQYIEQNNGSSSLGARFDMWKSALLGIQEKPIFGWGLQGVKTMRQQHAEQKQISKVAGEFGHAHNQYLHDASARGLLGLAALLAIFLVPLRLFWLGMKRSAPQSLARLWGVLGMVHILAIMGYCLSQSFLSHNSGVMFYGFVVVLLLGLQKNASIRPLDDEKIE